MKKEITLDRAIPQFLDYRRSLNLAPLTVEWSKHKLDVLEKFMLTRRRMKTVLLKDIIRKDILSFDVVLKKYMKQVSVRNYMIALVSFFRWAHKESYILVNPMRGMRFAKPPRDISRKTISEKEIEQLINSIDYMTPIGLRDRAVIELMYSTGLRRAEVSNLRLYDIDFNEGTLRVNQGKGRKDRIVPVGFRAVAWVKRYVEQSRPGLMEGGAHTSLFLSPRKEKMNDFTLAKMIRVRMRRIGLRHSPHSLRHAFATALLRRGADIAHIQAMLGHASIDSTQIYTEVVDEDLRKTLAKNHPGA